MKEKYNNLWLGLVLGIIVPVIAMLGYYKGVHGHMTLRGFIRVIHIGGTSSALISLGVVANLVLFYVFLQKEKYYSARGVILATFLYTALVVYLKFDTL